MSEAVLTHHKIKAEWTKAAENEIFEKSSSASDKFENGNFNNKIEILEQVVIQAAQISTRSVKCHFCDKNVNSSNLSEHQKLHEETFYFCTYQSCEKKFKRKSSLRKHTYVHKGKYKYECTLCNIKFIDLSKFELHKNTKHKTKDSVRWKCQEKNCGKLFASPDYLKRHQVTHQSK